MMETAFFETILFIGSARENFLALGLEVYYSRSYFTTNHNIENRTTHITEPFRRELGDSTQKSQSGEPTDRGFSINTRCYLRTPMMSNTPPSWVLF
jgi:hypothetical protein